MPERFNYETAMTIDHDEEVARVDTTVKAVATQLIRTGFREVGDARSLPYRRFLGQADQIRFRLPKGKRKVGGAARKSVEAAKDTPRTPAPVGVAAENRRSV